MSEKYQIVPVEKPEESAWGIIGRGLSAFNKEKTGRTDFKRICYAIYDEDEKIVGGILGEVYWDWLYVDLLWLPEELRGQGYGHQLLTKLEKVACKAGAKHAYLDTFSFQMPDFYKDHGYEVFGELADFPPAHQRFFFRKEL